MNKLTNERRAGVILALCEGNSIRSTARMTGVAINTVVKLLTDLGTACLDYQDANMRNLPCKRLQADEIWSFIYSKAKNVPSQHEGEFGYGDVWTWTALDADTKLIPCWRVGNRDGREAYHFMRDLAARLSNRVQLTTDGHRAYLEAVEGAFGANIDYAMLIKLYGAEPDRESSRRYSSADCIGTETRVVTGKPDKLHISTSYAERQNLTMRMSMRRFTRLTNAFSKKLENHMHALALYFMHYNFCRPHKSLANPYHRTPAMAAGLTDHIWTTEELLSLLDRPN
ncbi:MAG: DDE-type integrase/transposase/recombinase [Chloroflexi bacterium]|nr:DDE-type integrase/transposase/recombinase [Chloroflexota bacterium]